MYLSIHRNVSNNDSYNQNNYRNNNNNTPIFARGSNWLRTVSNNRWFLSYDDKSLYNYN